MLPDLTPEQREAVAHARGPLLVLAGAGSGKTRVLCRRLAHLVEGGTPPGAILALAFNSRAAEELRVRSEALIGRSHETLRVMTFHAWGRELLRVHGAERGLAQDLEPVTAETRALLLLERLRELDLSAHDLRRGPMTVVSDIVRRIDNCRDHMIEAATFAGWAQARRGEARRPSEAARADVDVEFARVFARHDEILSGLGLQDFGSMLLDALALLRTHADRLAAAREATRHVLVDEFQDTNHTQAALLHLVADGADSLVVVGDDDQGIYRFRGASTRNIRDFRARFPAAPVVRLERNYRSSQAILDAAHAVVAPLADREAKRLRAEAGAAGPAPELWLAEDASAQARAVADRCVALAAQGVAFEEQAILMRAVRTEAQPIVDALRARGVPHQVHGGLSLFDRREVRVALGWLRVAVDAADGLAHLRVAAAPGSDVAWVDATGAVTAAAREGGSVTAALAAVAGPELARRLETAGRAGALSPPAALARDVLDGCGPRRDAVIAGGADGAAALDSLAKLEELADGLLRSRPDLDGPGLVRALDALSTVRVAGPVGQAGRRVGVQVMTIHQAKGLEFDAVIVVGLSERRWPGRDRATTDIPDALLPEALPDGPEARLAEARRLAYVALTRARRHLVVVADGVGGGSLGRASRLFDEAHEALGRPPLPQVGAAPGPAAAEAVGAARDALEAATLEAALAAADGRPEAAALRAAALAAAEALVDARAGVVRGLTPSPPPSPPSVRTPAGQHLSPSGIVRYLGCPLQYRFAQVDRIPRPQPASVRIGNAVHRALEAHFRPGGDGGDGARLVTRFAAELRREGLAGDPEGRQALERGRRHLPAYLERVRAGTARPAAVERSFTLMAGPHAVRGRIDRVDELPGHRFRLVDYKTSAPPANREAGGLVLALYAAGARDAWGVEVDGATLEYVLDGANRPVDPDRAELGAAVERAREVGDAIARERYEPSPGWHCTTCPYALVCPAQDR